MVNDVWLCLFQVEIPHLCLDVIFDEVDDVAKIVIQATWADQLLHLTAFIAAGYLADQPEHDTLCCEGAQTCKQCKCPKTLLHEARTMFPPRRGHEVEAAVRRAFRVYPPPRLVQMVRAGDGSPAQLPIVNDIKDYLK